MTELLRYKYDKMTPDPNLNSGLSSTITWAELENAFKIAFNIRPYETLIGVIITDEGVEARISIIKDDADPLN